MQEAQKEIESPPFHMARSKARDQDAEKATKADPRRATTVLSSLGRRVPGRTVGSKYPRPTEEVYGYLPKSSNHAVLCVTLRHVVSRWVTLRQKPLIAIILSILGSWSKRQTFSFWPLGLALAKQEGINNRQLYAPLATGTSRGESQDETNGKK